MICGGTRGGKAGVATGGGSIAFGEYVTRRGYRKG